ncbi:MAG: AAA family ATPase [Dehalococcoidales bacterium]|nr:MAG: AAA family ATPase [Dehalococcoidales bacterium]
MDMFERQREGQMSREAPLAARMRPTSLDDFVGQGHLVGEGHVIRNAIEGGQIPSVILWGPPGSGKTTLAFVIANTTDSHFSSVSAVSAGVADLRRMIQEARERRRLHQQKTILFIDEIHRFNKAQQDAVLPYVEDGTVTLIGATTENPSFEVNAPLLSRSRVLVLNPLTDDEIRTIILRALEDSDSGLGKLSIEVDDEAMAHLIMMSSHDARIALNTLELAVLTAPPDRKGKRHVTLSIVEDAAQKRMLRYDKAGEEHFDLISALHKSMRGSDPDASLYWLGRMLEAGEDPLYVARRLVRFASEDVGMADPQALVVAMAAQQAVHFIGLPEGNLALAEAAVYLATAPKSNSLYRAYSEVQVEIKEGSNDPVPLHLRNAATPLMRQVGYGKGYKYAHDYEGHFVEQQNLPDSLQGKKFYQPGDQGYEKQIAARLNTWRPGSKQRVRKASKKMSNSRVDFRCGEITLEAVWHLPQGKGPFPVVVVCHPHSLYGGNMQNNVVVAICEALSQQGIAAFRFNFRGVEGSGGQFGGGVAERDDVKAALDFVISTENINPEKVGLAGYSFGGSVALPVALEEKRVRNLVLVSPALTESGWQQLEKYPHSKLVIVGGNDSVIRLEQFQQLAAAAGNPEEYQTVAGADHFWWGLETELAQKVADFFAVAYG